MSKSIFQQLKFKVPPGKLYDTYMDSKHHSAATGSPAMVGKKNGDKMTAWDGYITGTILAALPKTLVVQTWRAADWDEDQPDSVLVLEFSSAKGGSLLTMVHAGVPDDQEASLDEGWHENYWEPWRAHFERKG